MTEPAAAKVCEHYWAYHVHGGHSIRLCQLCHEPDWDDLDAQIAAAVAEALKSAAREQHEGAWRSVLQELWDAEGPRLLAEVAAATDERLEQAVAQAIASHPFALAWRDERGTEICRSAAVMPGTVKIAIPLDAQSADLITEPPTEGIPS